MLRSLEYDELIPKPSAGYTEPTLALWVHQWSTVTTNTWIPQYSHFTDDELYVIVQGDVGLDIITVATGVVNTTANFSSRFNTFFAEHDKSRGYRYFVQQDSNWWNVHIYDRNTLLQTIQVDSIVNNDLWRGVCMSPSGRHILLMHRDNEIVDVHTYRLYSA